MREPGTIERLVPGEFVRLDVEGQVDGPVWLQIVSFVLDLIGGTNLGDWSRLVRRGVHVGTTEHDLVIAEMGCFGKVHRVRRIPLNNVKVVKYTGGDPKQLFEEVELDLGEAKPLRVYLLVKNYQLNQPLIDALGGLKTEPEMAP